MRLRQHVDGCSIYSVIMCIRSGASVNVCVFLMYSGHQSTSSARMGEYMSCLVNERAMGGSILDLETEKKKNGDAAESILVRPPHLSWYIRVLRRYCSGKKGYHTGILYSHHTARSTQLPNAVDNLYAAATAPVTFSWR